MGQALWFASRGTGLVSLLMVTATVVLGVAHTERTTSARWPRFTMHAVHRNLSLLTLFFLAVHIATAIIDPYAGLTWLDAVVPFVSSYQPLWLGLGTVAMDLMIAVLLTSMVRMRIPLRLWRAVHVSAYAMWPLAVVHGLGIGGADSRLGWVIGLNVACGVAVGTAVAWRVLVRHPDAQAAQPAGAR